MDYHRVIISPIVWQSLKHSELQSDKASQTIDRQKHNIWYPLVIKHGLLEKNPQV
jgi:hypothetical protein